MRPEKLAFSAFGPFVERQEIDFTVFEKAGVFLIHGETGAGKTVILDAMTYALYGKSSGGVRGDLSAMRCQFAKESQPTEVLYEFSLQQRKYRFLRGLRLKKKKDGTVEYIPYQEVFYIEPDGSSIPFFEHTRLRDIEEKAQEVLGLSYEQFIQVVILPQGKFERLLLAKSEEKENILVSLFRADIWQRTADILCGQVREQKQQLEQKRQELQQELARYQCTSIEELQKQYEKTELELQERQEQQKQLYQRWERRTQQLQQATIVEQLFCQLQEKQTQWQNLSFRKKEMAHQEKLIVQAKKVRQVLPLYDRWMKEKESAARLQEREQRQQEQLIGYQQELRELHSHAARLEEQRGLYEKTKAALEKNEMIRKQYQQLQEAKQEKEEALAHFIRLKNLLKSSQGQQQRLQQEKERVMQAQQVVMLAYTAKIPEYRQQLSDLKQQREWQIRIEQLRQEEKEVQANEQQAEQIWKQREKNAALLREQYQKAVNLQLTGMAQLLAERLQEGKPCPVCGSLHHPAPTACKEKPEEQQVEELQRQVSEAQKASLQAQQNWMNWKLKRKQLQQQGEQQPAVAFDEHQFIACQKQLQAAEEQQQKWPQYEVALQSCNERLEQCLVQTKNLQEDYLLAQQQQETAQQRFLQIAAALGGEVPEWEKLQKIMAQQQQEVYAWEQQWQQIQKKLEECRMKLEAGTASVQILNQEWTRAMEQQAEGKKAFYNLCNTLQLDWQESLRQEVAEETTIAQWEQEQQQYQFACQSCKQAMEDFQKKLEGVPRPNIAALEEEVQRLHQLHVACIKDVSVQQEMLQNMHNSMQWAKSQEKRLREKSMQWQQDQQFAHMLRGDNGVSLQRYVLGVMLSSITVEANKMLKQVHDGRYQLLRTMEKRGRSRKAGLELEVFDQLTGMRRSVASLSGGEKFLVSLSLSLGLSAVVQAGCGGIRLQAMFIDEGFGTLDESSITDALHILSQIRHAGGIVGVISHVSLLKENIQCGIVVDKKNNGSSLKIIR